MRAAAAALLLQCLRPAAATAAPSLGPSSSPTGSPACTRTVADLIYASAEYGNFSAALNASAANATLALTAAPAPFTVFAPTDAAWDKLGTGDRQWLADEPAMTSRVVANHIVAGSQVDRADLPTASPLLSTDGSSLSFSIASGVTRVNGAAQIVAPFDGCASNGVMHSVDVVLVPTSVPLAAGDLLSMSAANNQLGKLVAAVKKAGLELSLQAAGPLTLFAPRDAAFDLWPAGQLDALMANPDVLKKVISYHVVEGYYNKQRLVDGGPSSALATLQGSAMPYSVDALGKVVTLRPGLSDGDGLLVLEDLRATNGVVHVIDKVLLPPDVPLPAPIVPTPPPTLPVAAPSPNEVIPLLAARSQGLTKTAELWNDPAIPNRPHNILSGGGPFTVFAPTNQAWAALPEGQKEYLNDFPAEMNKVLLYHVVQGNSILASGLPAASPLITMSGDTLMVSRTTDLAETRYLADRTSVLFPVDLRAANGVVHVSGGVPIPASVTLPSKDLSEVISGITRASTFWRMVLAASRLSPTDLGALGVLRSSGPLTIFVPSDGAWSRLPAGQLEAIMRDPTLVRAVIDAHIVDQYVAAADMRPGPGSLATRQGGGSLVYSTDLKGVTAVNRDGWFESEAARLEDTVDLRATNGIAHFIDSPLIPKHLQLPQPATLDILKADPAFRISAELANLAGFDYVLRDTRPLTFFAPTDAAWGRLPTGVLAVLRRRGDAAAQLLRHHVVVGERVASTALVSRSPMRTLAGEPMTAAGGPGAITLQAGSAKLLAPDLFSVHAVVHGIDAVLMPSPGAVPLMPTQTVARRTANHPQLHRFAAAIASAGLLDGFLERDIGPLTLFAPTNSALDALPPGVWERITGDAQLLQRIVRYHMVRGYYSVQELRSSAPGKLSTVDDSTVLTGRRVHPEQATQIGYAAGGPTGKTIELDQRARVTEENVTGVNGIVHATDALLVPTDLHVDVFSSTGLPLNLLSLLQKRGDASTFASLVVSSGADAMLTTVGAMTVFAPSDTAWRSLPTGHSALIARRRDVAAAAVRYHIVPTASFLASQLARASPVSTVEGGVITAVNAPPGDVTLNGKVRVSGADNQATNGVLHLVDGLLVRPDATGGSGWALSLPATKVREVVAAHPSLDRFEAAIGTCGAPCVQVLDGAGPFTVFAPSDDVATVPADAAAAQAYVYRHVARGYLSTLDAVGGAQADTLANDGTVIRAAVSEGVMRVDSLTATASVTDLPASNGVVHVLTSTVGRSVGAVQRGGDDDDDSTMVTLIVIAACVMCCACIVLFAVLLLCMKKRRKKQQRRGAGSDASSSADSEMHRPRHTARGLDEPARGFDDPQMWSASPRNPVLDLAPAQGGQRGAGTGQTVLEADEPPPRGPEPASPASPDATAAHEKRLQSYRRGPVG